MNPVTSGAIAPVRPELLPAYSPTTYVDFSQPQHRAAFEAALARVRAELGREVPLVLGGERLQSPSTFPSTNPARPSEVIGRFQSGTREQAERAVEIAYATFPTWSRVPADERAAYLIEAAKRMRERRHVFSAWMVLEIGKSWAEADADTAEAIDFMEFYAREMLRYAAPQPVHQLPGEKDSLVYLPIGVGAVIPPWNFPLAICVGMTTAAVVTGNTVVLKPASDTPAIAWQFFSLMEEVGLPPGVLNFLTGGGGVVGERARAAPADPLRVVHRLEGGRHRHQPARGRGAAGPDLAQARRRRDGRQGRNPRRRRGGSRRRRARRGAERLRLRRAEVLGLLARDRRRIGARPFRGQAARADREDRQASAIPRSTA